MITEVAEEWIISPAVKYKVYEFKRKRGGFGWISNYMLNILLQVWEQGSTKQGQVSNQVPQVLTASQYYGVFVVIA